MCARIDVLSTAGAFAANYVRQNPKATEMEVQVAVREHLQDLRKAGEKVSAKGLSQVAPTVREIYTSEQAKANLRPVATPVVQRAAKKFNANAAVNHYEQILGMGDGARKRWHQKNMTDAKTAFATDEYLEVLKRNNPAEYEKELTRLQAESNVVSNNAAKKEANAGYLSSKKKKAAKKSAETASHAEHKRVRINNSKPAREARYMTANGLMKTEGRKLYQALNAHEIIADAPWKSAEESMKVFLENDMIPEKSAAISARVFEEHGLTDFEKGLAENKPVAAKPAAAATSSAGHTTAKAAETAAETAANAAKKAGKGKWGWIAAGVGVVAAAIGGKGYMDKQKAEQEKLSLSA